MRLGICMRNVDEVLRAYFMDVDDDDVSEIEFTNNLNEMKRLVNSKTVSILSAKIAGKPVRLVCTGNAKDLAVCSPGDAAPKVSGLDEANSVVLHGNFIVLGSHMEGEDEVFNSLDEDTMAHIKDHVALVDIGKGANKYNTYVMCDVELK